MFLPCLGDALVKEHKEQTNNLIKELRICQFVPIYLNIDEKTYAGVKAGALELCGMEKIL
jgi:hypothetical protein